MNFRRPPRRADGEANRRVSSRYGAVEIELQPIFEVVTGRMVAAEALARFPGHREHTVDETFALAHAAGRGPDLEAACLRVALRRKRLDMPAGVGLTVNVSPDALMHASVQGALLCDLTGVVIEITEHAAADLGSLQDSLQQLRERGARIAIDDASTGYAGLLRLTSLRPDIVKLDRGLVTGARTNVEQLAVIEAFVSLSRRIGARVLGEGVESLDDLIVLSELGVDYAQGFYLSESLAELPADFPDAMESCRIARGELLQAGAPTPGIGADIGTVTAALTACVRSADLADALAAASETLGIDVIALSTLTAHGSLREFSRTTDEVDTTRYPLVHYPATRLALSMGTLAEAHLGDPDADGIESALMRAEGIASLLLAPVIGRGRALGLLEFRHRSHRRWTGQDMAQARLLAEHIASVLLRLADTDAARDAGDNPASLARG